MSDIGYRTKVFSDIRYIVLQSDIGRSDIRLIPISLITDIGLSAHLWVLTFPGPVLEPSFQAGGGWFISEVEGFDQNSRLKYSVP